MVDSFLAGRQDFDEIARLVNSAYRTRVGWTHEADLIDGPRTTPVDLARELSGDEPAVVLCMRESAAGPIEACVLLRKKPDQCYLGMFSVAPEAQDRKLGRRLLEQSEDYARAWGSSRVCMTVLNVRDSLIAWYERRGYQCTGESIPFPYDNPNLGVPRLPDLGFIVLEKLL